MDEIVYVAFWVAVVLVIKIIADGITRRQLIAAGATAELARSISSSTKDPSRMSALKWGLVFAGVGSALILSDLLQFDYEDPIVTGMLLLFGAFGLLGFYRLTRPKAGEDFGIVGDITRES